MGALKVLIWQRPLKSGSFASSKAQVLLICSLSGWSEAILITKVWPRSAVITSLLAITFQSLVPPGRNLTTCVGKTPSGLITCRVKDTWVKAVAKSNVAIVIGIFPDASLGIVKGNRVVRAGASKFKIGHKPSKSGMFILVQVLLIWSPLGPSTSSEVIIMTYVSLGCTLKTALLVTSIKAVLGLNLICTDWVGGVLAAKTGI